MVGMVRKRTDYTYTLLSRLLPRFRVASHRGLLASLTQRHIGAASEQIECLSGGRQITLGDQDLERAKRHLLSDAAPGKKATKKCCKLATRQDPFGPSQGLCHAICKQVHGLPFARLCCVVLLVRCQFGC